MKDLIILHEGHKRYKICRPHPMYGQPHVTGYHPRLIEKRYIPLCVVEGDLDEATALAMILEKAADD